MTRRRGPRLSALVLLAGAATQAGCAGSAASAGATQPTPVVAPPLAGIVRDGARLPAIQVTAPPGGVLNTPVVAAALRSTDAFEEVDDGPGAADYHLVIQAVQPVRAGRGATTEASVSLHLLWRRQYVDSFNYRLPLQYAARRDPDPEDVARSLATRLVRDRRAINALGADALHAALQSSDYRGALALPERVGVWRRGELRVFRDPLLGAHVRYRQRDADAGHIDVFVYPIRIRDWNHSGTPLDDELGIELEHELGIELEHELASAARDLVKLHVHLQEHLPERPQDGSTLRDLRLGPVLDAAGLDPLRRPARRFSGEFADPRYQPFDLHGFALVRQDKIVKVLASIARHEAASADPAIFVRELLAGIDVPAESRFMARVRRAWSGR